MWGPQAELFVEFTPLVVGQPSRMAIHLTDMRDSERFLPVASGTVDVTLEVAGAAPVATKADPPKIPGIFGATVVPVSAGAARVTIALASPGASDRFVLETQVSATATMEVIRAVNLPNVGVLYDQANLSHMQQEDFAEALDLQRGRIVHVHVKDYVRKPGRAHSTSDDVAWMPAEGRAIITKVVGEGGVPWSQIIPALKATGYDGWLSLELEKRWYPDELPSEEEAFRRSAAFLKGLLE
jgi:hypothetical protein